MIKTGEIKTGKTPCLCGNTSTCKTKDGQLVCDKNECKSAAETAGAKLAKQGLAGRTQEG